MLDRQQQILVDARLNGATPAAPTFFAPGGEFTRLRQDTPWQREVPFHPVRCALKYQADAWQRFPEGKAGHPCFKRRGSRRRERTRRRLARTARGIAMVRRNWHHRTSRELANAAGTIVIENLQTLRMTRSAKGTAAKPGHSSGWPAATRIART